MSVPSTLPEELEALAGRLRAMAEAWCASGKSPELEVLGRACGVSALSYTDLIDDASDLEADARKLRTIYQ